MKSLAKWLPFLMLVVGGMAVRADDTPGAPVPTPPPLQHQLTYGEMTGQVSTFSKQLEQDRRHLEHLRAEARKQQDVIKLNCVNGKLVELKAQQNIFDNARQQFEASQNNLDVARTQYGTMLDVAGQGSQLRGEGDVCVGVPELYKQEAKNEVSHPEFPDDPTVGNPFLPETVEPPAYASPFD